MFFKIFKKQRDKALSSVSSFHHVLVLTEPELKIRLKCKIVSTSKAELKNSIYAMHS